MMCLRGIEPASAHHDEMTAILTTADGDVDVADDAAAESNQDDAGAQDVYKTVFILDHACRELA